MDILVLKARKKEKRTKERKKEASKKVQVGQMRKKHKRQSYPAMVAEWSKALMQIQEVISPQQTKVQILLGTV